MNLKNSAHYVMNQINYGMHNQEQMKQMNNMHRKLKIPDYG